MATTTPPPPPPIEPNPSIPPATVGFEPLPWEQPGQPPFEALFETAKLLFTRPGEAFQRMPRTGNLVRPVLFSIIFGWLGVIFSQLYSIAFGGFQMPGLEGIEGMEGLANAGMSLGITLTLMVLAPLFIIIGLAIQTAIFHLMLMLIGGAGSSFETTLRVCCYASVVQVVQILPFCGGLIALVWSIVLLVIGLAIAHETTHGKAAVAVIAPIVFCCACGVLVMVLGFGGMIAALASQ